MNLFKLTLVICFIANSCLSHAAGFIGGTEETIDQTVQTFLNVIIQAEVQDNSDIPYVHTEAGRQYVNSVASSLGGLEAGKFNDALYYLLEIYASQPSTRTSIEKLLKAMHDSITSDLDFREKVEGGAFYFGEEGSKYATAVLLTAFVTWHTYRLVRKSYSVVTQERQNLTQLIAQRFPRIPINGWTKAGAHIVGNAGAFATLTVAGSAAHYYAVRSSTLKVDPIKALEVVQGDLVCMMQNTLFDLNEDYLAANSAGGFNDLNRIRRYAEQLKNDADLLLEQNERLDLMWVNDYILQENIDHLPPTWANLHRRLITDRRQQPGKCSQISASAVRDGAAALVAEIAIMTGTPL